MLIDLQVRMYSTGGHHSARGGSIRLSTRRKILLFLIALVIAVPGAYSAITSSASTVLGPNNYDIAQPGTHITMIGVNHVIQGPPENYGFVQSIASQGLKWDRDSVGNNTQKLADMAWAQKAGINVLALIGGGDPETSCTEGGTGSGVLQPESQYKSYIQQIINDWPWIHTWEYSNEPQWYWCNISPEHFFQGLVWTYEVISSTPGHQSDTIISPTETIYTNWKSGVWDGYDGCGSASCVDSWDGSSGDKIGWFYTFWHQSITDAYGTWTPPKILTYVSLHVYTQGELFSDTPAAGPYGTVGAMLSAALNAYYSVTGNSKDFIISETGMISDSSGGLTKQTTWYQQMMPFYQSLNFVTGVFAYSLYEPGWGLFSPNLQPKPAWFVYQSYFEEASTTTTVTSSSSSTSLSISPSPTSSEVTSSSLSSTLGNVTNSSTTTNSFTTSLRTALVPTTASSGSNTGLASKNSQDSNFITTTSSTSAPESPRTGIQSESALGFLSSLSPSRNPPVAYGFLAYEVPLIAVFLSFFANFLRFGARRWTLRN